MSILSDLPDGMGYFYGFIAGDSRQINVRREDFRWKAYVGGEPLDGEYTTKIGAEAGAVAWMKAHPQS
jgi:hypothetical protein